MALSDLESHCNQEEWLKELENSSLTNEAEGQTISARCMKLLENGHDSETSMRESSADVDLKISCFGFMRHGLKKCQENEEA